MTFALLTAIIAIQTFVFLTLIGVKSALNNIVERFDNLPRLLELQNWGRENYIQFLEDKVTKR